MTMITLTTIITPNRERGSKTSGYETLLYRRAAHRQLRVVASQLTSFLSGYFDAYCFACRDEPEHRRRE